MVESYLSVKVIETTEGREVCENVYVLLNSHVIVGSVLEVGTRSDKFGIEDEGSGGMPHSWNGICVL